MSAPIVKLRNRIQHYAWGSRHAIAALQGRLTPTREPEAELWIGDHPTAPSAVWDSGSSPDPGAATETPLPDWIARAPDEVLGAAARRAGPQLPFLAKILAAARPLSLQVHPGAEQARAGFERERSRGVTGELRSYPDRAAKREMLVALSRFEALCGLRADADVTRRLGESGGEQARKLLASAGGSAPADSPCLAARLLREVEGLAPPSWKQLVDELCSPGGGSDAPADRDERFWVARLAEEHPDDSLAIAPLLLNLVALAPGEALVVEPGTLHCYLEGVGVELMTRSDNVVRAGLTRKRVDPAEAWKIANLRASPPRRIAPSLDENGLDASYASGIQEFEVSVLEIPPGRTVSGRGGRPQVLLCIDGDVAVRACAGAADGGVELGPGETALIPACVESYEVRGAAGSPKLFVVSSG